MDHSWMGGRQKKYPWPNDGVHEYHQDNLFLEKFDGHHFCTFFEVMPKHTRASNSIHIVISLRQVSKTGKEGNRFLVTMACEYKEGDEWRAVLETQHRIYLSSTTGDVSIELLQLNSRTTIQLVHHWNNCTQSFIVRSLVVIETPPGTQRAPQVTTIFISQESNVFSKVSHQPAGLKWFNMECCASGTWGIVSTWLILLGYASLRHYLRPYVIQQKVGRNAYRLKLPTSMTHIHPVFNVVKLLPVPDDPIPGQWMKPPPPPEIVDSNDTM